MLIGAIQGFAISFKEAIKVKYNINSNGLYKRYEDYCNMNNKINRIYRQIIA